MSHKEQLIAAGLRGLESARLCVDQLGQGHLTDREMVWAIIESALSDMMPRRDTTIGATDNMQRVTNLAGENSALCDEGQ